MKSFLTLVLKSAGARSQRLFTAYVHENGFTVKGIPDRVFNADELACELRRRCLNSIDANGAVVMGWLDSYEHLPTQFPEALRGGIAWELHVGGYSCNLRIVREVHTRRFEALLLLHRALFVLTSRDVDIQATTAEVVATLFP